MALHLISLGAGEHRISTEGWQEVLGATARGYPKRASIATHVQELVFSGWIRRREGGSGSPFYSISLPYPQGMVRSAPVPSGDGKAETAPVPSGDASGSPIPSGDVFRAPPGTPEPSPPPPILPSTSSSYDARVREAMEEHEELRGLRGALADYFALGRVPNPYAYTMTILGWIQGTDPSVWVDPRGGESLHDGRQKVIAGCLNDLANCEEVGRYFPAEPGDAANLRAKIRFKVRSILGARRDAARHALQPTGTDGAPPPSRQRREVRIGE